MRPAATVAELCARLGVVLPSDIVDRDNLRSGSVWWYTGDLFRVMERVRIFAAPNLWRTPRGHTKHVGSTPLPEYVYLAPSLEEWDGFPPDGERP